MSLVQSDIFVIIIIKIIVNFVARARTRARKD
jgi:hypothetical protein